MIKYFCNINIYYYIGLAGAAAVHSAGAGENWGGAGRTGEGGGGTGHQAGDQVNLTVLYIYLPVNQSQLLYFLCLVCIEMKYGKKLLHTIRAPDFYYKSTTKHYPEMKFNLAAPASWQSTGKSFYVLRCCKFCADCTEFFPSTTTNKWLLNSFEIENLIWKQCNPRWETL